jgi:hypothetical protein
MLRRNSPSQQTGATDVPGKVAAFKLNGEAKPLSWNHPVARVALSL